LVNHLVNNSTRNQALHKAPAVVYEPN